MKGTARELVTWIKDSIKSMAVNPEFGSLKRSCEEISKLSGISVSSIQKIYDGRADNPTASTIDKLVVAIKQANRKAAA